jgi:hypothetical protein
LIAARSQLNANAAALQQTLQQLGMIHPNIEELLRVSSKDLTVDQDQSANLIEIQNQLADLRAVSAVTRTAFCFPHRGDLHEIRLR